MNIFGKDLPTHSGLSLLEMLIGLAVLGLVTTAATILYRSTQQQINKHSALASSSSEMTILNQRLTKYFASRVNPTTYSGSLANGGSAINLTFISAKFANQNATSTIQTQCIAVPPQFNISGANLSKLATMARQTCAAAPCPACRACPSGQMPVVTIADSLGVPTVVPALAGGGSSQRAIAAGICLAFQPAITGGAPDLVANISLATVDEARQVTIKTTSHYYSAAQFASEVQVLK